MQLVKKISPILLFVLLLQFFVPIMHINSFAINNTGHTYYVSANGTSKDGTDINKPMSLQEANTKTFSSNDKVLFKSGDIFYGVINFNVNASDGSPLYIGSYGNGQKPILSGSRILVNLNAWKSENGLYKLDLSNASSFSGISNWNYNIGFIEDENGNIYGARKNSIDSLKNDNDFYCSENFLYLKSSVHPRVSLGKIKLVSNINLVSLSSNTNLENLNIQNTGAHGIVKKTPTVKNVTIKDCIIQNIGGSVLTENDFTRYGNGIEFNRGDVENILIEGNIIRNVYDTAFTLQGTIGYWKNITVSKNIFIKNTQNSELWTANSATEITNYVYTDNLSVSCGRGWGYDVRPNKNVAADYIMYGICSKLTSTVSANTSFNSIRMFYIKPTSDEIFRNSVAVDNNNVYALENSYIINDNIKNLEEFRKQYNMENSSTYRTITTEDISKIENNNIMNSNDYSKIKSYYLNLEEEILNRDFKSNSYKITNKYVASMLSNTTYKDFKNSIVPHIPYSIKEHGNELLDNSTIKTGQVLTIENRSYDLVVLGDLNSDGKFSIVDITIYKKFLIKKINLSNNCLKAADMNFDNETNLTDLVRMKKKLIGL